MIWKIAPLCAVVALGACGGNPIGSSSAPPPVTPPPEDTGIDSDRAMPPGTPSPQPETRIVRREPRTGGNVGDGFAENFAYDSATDTFSVDNLGFDADNVYTRGVAVGSLGPFAVYESAMVYSDDLTGAPIEQFLHRGIYGVSRTGQTEFAIARTGAYAPFGFGGFIYQRNGPVSLPTSGQARFDGNYAALRDFAGRGGIEYATGDMTMAIDFRDFNDGSAVDGRVANRTIYDLAGNDITATVVAALNTENQTNLTSLPTLVFTVGPGVLDSNGELLGQLTSNFVNSSGAVENYETGKYYAVLSGDEPDEVVGVIVVEASDPRYTGVRVRETGGFILYRRP